MDMLILKNQENFHQQYFLNMEIKYSY